LTSTVTLAPGENNLTIDMGINPAAIFDLALVKTTTATTVNPGADVTYTIQVINQGNVDAYNIQVNDYVPAGMTFNPASNPGWFVLGGNPWRNILGPLAAGASTSVTITLTVNANFTGTNLTNMAEINGADNDTDPSNGSPLDDDSTPNNNPNDDVVGGNDVTNNMNGDEDDSDIAIITVIPNVPGVATLGDLVWYDNNHDGVQGMGENGVPNIIVILYSAGGVEVGRDTTDANGMYLFTMLAPGTYNVQFVVSTLPNGYSVTTVNQGGNDAIDSDANATGADVPVTLVAGQTDLTHDLGIYPSLFDQALDKKLAIGQATNVNPGDDVTYTLKVYNQGTSPAYNVVVTDYIPTGMTFDVAKNAGWTLVGNQASTTIPGPIASLTGTHSLNVVLTLSPSFTGNSINNFAEISSADNDNNPNNGSPVDIDSPHNNNPADDVVGGDNVIDNTGGDSDDHDGATIGVSIFDLALVKMLAPGQATAVPVNSTINFRIKVTNQGNIAAQNVQIVDFLPVGLTLTDPDWTNLGNGKATYTLAGPIAPGATAFVDITFFVPQNTPQSAFVNIAEITSAADPSGIVRTDVDSSPDGTSSNDPIGGNDTVNNENGDEDDNDYEVIAIIPKFDPLGYIYCDKTGKLITGGEITVVPPPGGQVFFVNNLRGQNGQYWFLTNGVPGIYTINYSHPLGFPVSTNCVAQAGAFDPTGNDGNPLYDNDGSSTNAFITFGSDTLAGGDYLIDHSCAANKYYMQFNLATGDPEIQHNNIPVSCILISSIACNDANNNDLNDTGDLPIPNMKVYLFDCDDLVTPLDSTLTDNLGHYKFDGLLAGSYVVKFNVPANVRPTSDSPVNNLGFSDCITLAYGQCDTLTFMCLYACPPSIITPVSATICEGDDVQLQVSGATSNIVWSPAATLSGSTITNPIASPLVTTTYTVSHNDLQGCQSSANVVVTVIPTNTPTVTVSPSANCLVPTGVISVNSTLPGVKSYSIDNGSTWQSSNVFNGLGAGSYTVVARMDNAPFCESISVIAVITGATPMTIVEGEIDHNLCNNASTPVSITASSAIASYTINATSGYSNVVVTGNTITFNAFLEGIIDNFSVTLTGANGCQAVETFVINRISQPESDFVVNGLTCANDTVFFKFTGTASATALLNWNVANGTIVYTSPATATQPAGFNIGVIFPSDGPRMIMLGVNDGGCLDQHVEAVNISKPPTALAGPDLTVCAGACVTLQGENKGGVVCAWSGGANISNPNIHNPSVCPTATSNYVFFVMDALGCMDFDTTTVTVNGTVPVISGDSIICVGETATLTASGGVSYTWSNGAITAATTFTPIVTTTYTVTVTSAQGCTATKTVRVTVNPLPTVAITTPGNDVALCLGEGITLTATGGTSYVWSNGLTTASIAVTPIVTTTYTVTATNANGCTNTATLIITVNPLPTANAGVDQTICQNASATLTATGGVSYAWNNGAITATTTVTPVATTTYIVTATDANGCTDTDDVIVNVNTVAANAGPDVTICSGGTTMLVASGGTSYLWSNGVGTAMNIVMPTVTTTYTVTVTNAIGCTGTDQVTVTVNGLPTAVVTPSTTICPGQCVFLTASGGVDYLWFPPTGLNASNVATVKSCPTATTTYIVFVEDANGCQDTALVTVTVQPYVISAGPDQTLCAGQSATLTASAGGTTYLWSNGATTATVNVTPAVTTTYTVTVINATGCTGTDQVVVNVNPAVAATIAGTTTICAGQSTTLTAAGGATYLWNTGATTAAITVTPAATTTYTATVTAASGCTATVSSTVTVNPNPTAAISGNTTLCNGAATTLTATGGASYVWSNGATTATINVTPTATTTYTVTATNATGCTAIATTTVTVNPLPTATISGVTNICTGQSTTLTATGGTTYLWNNGLTTASITVMPSATTAYTVTVTSGAGCTAVSAVSVTVNPQPIVSFSGDLNICTGETTILSISGGTGFLWSTGATTASISVNPTVSTTYTVTISNAAGCTSTASATVNVSPLPAATISGVNTVCIGGTTALTAAGGLTYLWSNGATSATINVTPSAATTYTVTATNNAGCTASASTTVTISPAATPTIAGNLNICAGGSTALTVSGAVSYLWSNGSTLATLTVSPLATTTYTVTATNASGCTGTASATVNVGVGPTVAIQPGNVAICQGSGVMLMAIPTGGVAPYTYSWSPTAGLSMPNEQMTLASPTATTTYTVTVTGANGCTGTASVTVTIKPAPAANAGVDQTVCIGGTTTLTATGGGTYLWSNGATTASTTVSPAATTNYTVTVTSTVNGCTATDNILVNVSGTITANSGADQTVCAGQATTLTATGGTIYAWSNGGTTASITVNPAVATTYTVTVSNAAGCTATDQVTVSIAPSLTVNAGADQAVCAGQAATLTATGGTSYLWSTGATTASINVTPSVATTYTVTVSNASGCTGTDAVQVTIAPALTVSAGADQSVCLGQAATLVATGGTSYLWSTGATTASINVTPSVATTYTVTVSNAAGCTGTDAVQVTIAPALTVSAGADQSVCLGQAATLVATGGTSYLWSTGATTASINVTPSVATTYTVTVSNAAGCTGTDAVQVTIAPALTVSAGADQSVCLGQAATLVATGGTSYLWSTGATTASINVTPSVATTYTVTVSNAAGCTGTDAVQVTITPGLTANAGVDQTVCAGQASSLTATGGTLFTWSTGATTATISITPAATTTYTVTVSNAAGCTGTDAVTVTVTPATLANAGADVTVCPGQSTTLTATGGTIYLWSNAVANAVNTVTPATTTTYTVTVSAGGGCTATDQVTVTISNPLVVTSPTLVNATCGLNNGSITALVTGGSGNYTYAWTGAVSTIATISNLATGTYIVTATDATSGCTKVQSFTITATPPTTLTAAEVTVTNALCFGGFGSITHIGAIPFTIKNGTFVVGITPVTNLLAGTYTVVKTVGGCEASITITITQPTTALNATTTIVKANCCGTGGQVTVNATGGTAPYIYKWTPNLPGSTNIGYNLNAGSYTITVTDANGCTKVVTASVTPDCSGCPDIVSIDSINATPASIIPVCLPGMTQSGLQALQIFVDGTLYQGQYHGCAYDTLVIYNYSPLLVTGNAPFRLLSWTCNGNTFSDSTITSIQQLVTKMNVWDPTGNWQLNTANSNIVGGQIHSGVYSSMSFVNLNNWTPATLNPNYGGIATGTSIDVPGGVGKRTIVFVNANCCRDTLCVFVAPANTNGGNPTSSTLTYNITVGQNASDCLDITQLPGIPTSYTTSCAPSHGTVTMTNNNCFVYQPTSGYIGTENFCIVACSGTVCDTFFVIVNIAPLPVTCNDFIAETTLSASAASCSQNGSVCIGLPLDQIPFHAVTLDGAIYTGGFMGCNFDSAFSYLYSTIPNQGSMGPYNATWTYNGTTNNTTFNTIGNLVDWMNSLDVNGNWQLNPATLTIRGGVQANTYGTISIVQTSTGGMATLSPNLNLLPNGISLSIPVGTHKVIFTEIATGCKDSINVTITCPSIPDQTTAVTIQEGFNGTLCLNGFVTNGATITTVTNTCANQATPNALVVINNTTNCVTYTGITAGVDTACLRICLSSGQCFNVTMTINVTAAQPCQNFIARDTFALQTAFCTNYNQQFCVNIPYLTIGNYDIAIDGLAYTSGLVACNYEGTGVGTGTQLSITQGGTHKIVFTQLVGGCKDSITVLAPCVPNLTPDYIVANIRVGDKDTFCLKIDELPGNVMSVQNACPGTGEFVVFDRISGSLCYLCTGMEVGQENVCFVLCDDQGFCDTTYMKVNVREADQQQVPIGQVDVDTTLTNLPINIDVLRNDTIAAITSLHVSRQPMHGMAIKQDNNTITYTPFNEYCNEETPDNFEYVVCNSAGCDTVQVFVWVICDKLKVFTSFSPNGDNMNDFFYVEGLSNFPKNKVAIYNRWGNLVYNKEKYDNSWDGSWKGAPLPDGTYFWIFDDGEGKTYSGYVELRR
jgi:gliding motility-associated-like protein/uncharacterized repeat protein (TIGR01451 family)